jgi:hypothetical protein
MFLGSRNNKWVRSVCILSFLAVNVLASMSGHTNYSFCYILTRELLNGFSLHFIPVLFHCRLIQTGTLEILTMCSTILITAQISEVGGWSFVMTPLHISFPVHHSLHETILLSSLNSRMNETSCLSVSLATIIISCCHLSVSVELFMLLHIGSYVNNWISQSAEVLHNNNNLRTSKVVETLQSLPNSLSTTVINNICCIVFWTFTALYILQCSVVQLAARGPHLARDNL